MAPSSRPLSPHLSIYRFTLTMTMSIVHRATGIALYGGMALLALWLAAAAIGGGVFDAVNWLLGSWLGYLVLFAFTWALFHHMLGGIKHLVWDRRIGMDAVNRELIVRLNLAGSVLLTLAVWALFVCFK